MSREVQGVKRSPEELAQEIVRSLKEASEALYPGSASGMFQQYLSDPVELQRAMLS